MKLKPLEYKRMFSTKETVVWMGIKKMFKTKLIQKINLVVQLVSKLIATTRLQTSYQQRLC